MHPLSTELRSFTFGPATVSIRVPQVQPHGPGEQDKPQPYWARVWPAAIALCRHLAARPDLLAGKSVLELGAGLGLPGLLAAQWAREVTISDFMPEAVSALAAAAALNGLENVQCRLLDWRALPPDLSPDVLLLSDVNYEPAAFDTLFGMTTNFLENGATIILSTPQRLMAKPFIERLLPYCLSNTEEAIVQDGQQVLVNVLLLRRNP